MPISISSVYNDVALDDSSKDSAGDLSYERFNRYSRRAELRFLDWLTGDTKDANPPPPLNQKNRDFLSPLIKKFPAAVYNGNLEKPTDYYTWEDMYLIRAESKVCDDPEDDEITVIRQPIEILSSDKFNMRQKSYIEGLRPSFEKPICKLVGYNFEFAPKDVGSVELEYVRYPVKAQIVSKQDLVYNDLVVDEALSVNYEYPEFARPWLIWFITDLFSMHIESNSLKQFNTSSKP